MHSGIPKSDASALIEPSATVGLGLNSAAIHDVNCDVLFAASEFSASKLRLVRPVKESDCKVIDFGSNVQRVLTRIDGLRVCGEECHLHGGKLSLHSARRNLKFIGLPSGRSSRRVARFTVVLPVDKTKRLN